MPCSEPKPKEKKHFGDQEMKNGGRLRGNVPGIAFWYQRG
jgi:hypothetical protein